MANWKLWLKYALVRAIKTFAQTFASLITVGAAIFEVDWKYAISCSLVAMVYSILTSIGTELPEVRMVNDVEKYRKKAQDNEECYLHMLSLYNETKD